MYVEGQGLLGELEYYNGVKPNKKRPYLITKVFIQTSEIEIVDISSIKGKEHKLIYSNNHPIKNFNPPFIVPSFVKIHSARKISFDVADKMRLLNGVLNIIDLNEINSKI